MRTCNDPLKACDLFLEDLRTSVFLGALVFLCFFRARWAFHASTIADEHCYLATVYQILHLGREGTCPDNYFAPGTAILWLPGAIVGWVFAWMGRGELDPWIVPSIALLSFSYWVTCLFLLTRLLRASVTNPLPAMSGSLWGLVLLLNIPVLYYAVARPLMAHTSELMMALAALLALKRLRFALAIGLGASLCFIRYNDLPIFLVLAGGYIDSLRGEVIKKQYLLNGKKLLAIAAAVGIVALYVAWVATIRSYGGLTLAVLQEASFDGLGRFLVGTAWGVVWVQGWWLLTIVMGCVYFHRISFAAKGAILWNLVEVLLCISWGGNGADFAYRYLIGSSAGALIVWFDLLDQKILSWMAFRAVALAGAIWLTFLTSVYKTIEALGYVRADGSPAHFLLNLIDHILDPEVYKIMALQQVPFLSLLWTVRARESEFSFLSLNPSDFRILATVSIALTIVIGFVGIKTVSRKRALGGVK